jgi:flavin reductase (DIM6/NTAB) family NADH-FMN oxidoreductase RutF/rubredoxin
MQIEAYFKITYGLYVVSSLKDDKFDGFISNTVFQVTAEPPQFGIACSKNNYTAEMIKHSKVFAISVLQKDTRAEIIGTFGYKSGKNTDKFAQFKFKTGKTGVPILLDDVITWFECEVVQTIDAGSHLLFIGKVIDGELLSASGEPLTYAYYRDVKKGKAPKNAPTYIDPEKIKQQAETPMFDIYYCTACGHIYDRLLGEPEAGIPPGIRFEDLPDDWACPVCGAAKSDFVKKE